MGTLRRGMTKEIQQVGSHIRIGVLLHDQRCEVCRHQTVSRPVPIG